MRLDTETYAVVSLEEMKEARVKASESNEEYSNKYKNFLITCLCEAGLANKIVRIKSSERNTGVLKVEESRHNPNRPYEIKYHPVNKDGSVSKHSRYVHGCNLVRESTLISELKNAFEVVGDYVEG